MPATCRTPCRARGTEATPTPPVSRPLLPRWKDKDLGTKYKTVPRSCASEPAGVKNARQWSSSGVCSPWEKVESCHVASGFDQSPYSSYRCVKTKTVKRQDSRNGFLSQSAPHIKQASPCHRENPKEEKTVHFSVLPEASRLPNPTALSCDFAGQIEKPRAYPRVRAGM